MEPILRDAARPRAPCWAYSPSGAKIAEHNTCSPTAISAQAEMKLCPSNAGKWMDYTIQTMGNPTRKAAKVYCNATTKDANVEKYKEGPKKTDNTAVRATFSLGTSREGLIFDESPVSTPG